MLDALTVRFQTALDSLGWTGCGPQLQVSKPGFGHLQTALPLRLGPAFGMPPRDVAAQLAAAVDVADLAEVSVAGPGFLNVRLLPAVLCASVNAMLADVRLGVPSAPAERVVIDYSSPNVAKDMHVGHLRSTVIGDALARLLSFAGHDVVRQNHVGDWGTQFGMLLEQIASGDAGAGLYQRARSRFDSDPDFADRARSQVVALQAGSPSALAVWQSLVDASAADFAAVYARMGALLTPADLAGESSYNAALPGVVSDLLAQGLLRESEGALCAFLPGFTGRDGLPLPLIVRKSDGGFGYAATDLAALRHRISSLGASRIVYVVDARQALHFSQVFALAAAAGWLPPSVTVTHVAFGTVLGKDGRPFKTRSGETVALTTLLDDAFEAASAVLDERSSDLTEPARSLAAQAIGLAAVKYADLSNGLGRDYVFDPIRMVAPIGDTGPYLQYAHARLCTLLARAPLVEVAASVLSEPAEDHLAFVLSCFPAAVCSAAELLEPHRLCGYVHGLATALSAFYESCPVLTSSGDVLATRLALCTVTRRVLATGLALLGIDAPPRM